MTLHLAFRMGWLTTVFWTYQENTICFAFRQQFKSWSVVEIHVPVWTEQQTGLRQIGLAPWSLDTIDLASNLGSYRSGEWY